MISRKHAEDFGSFLPSKWQDQAAEELVHAFSQECTEHTGTFLVYGMVFKDEIVIILSFINARDISDSPATVFISSDLSGTDSKSQRGVLVKMLDCGVEIFNDYFRHLRLGEQWSELGIEWTPIGEQSETLYYRASRENVTLTIEAAKLLGELD